MVKKREGTFIACSFCKKEFYVPTYRTLTAKFCSNFCKNETRNKGKNEIVSKNNIKTYRYYYLYRTINTVNGKQYIGIHVTNNLNDGYIGNGVSKTKRLTSKSHMTHFRNAIKKHGIDNFVKEVLYFCDNYEDLLELEEFIVDEDFVRNTKNYNIALGGNNNRQPIHFLKYDLTYEDGTVFKGENIKEFCEIKNLDYTNICRLVKGRINKSQGYQRTKDYVKPKNVVIVNLETSEKFVTHNINKWCIENNFQELICKGSMSFNECIKKSNKILKKKWWLCYEEDWKGYIDLDMDKVKNGKIFTVIDVIANIEIKIPNVRQFCKENTIDISSFYSMLKGKTRLKNYKLQKIEYIFKNVNNEGTRIYIE